LKRACFGSKFAGKFVVNILCLDGAGNMEKLLKEKLEALYQSAISNKEWKEKLIFDEIDQTSAERIMDETDVEIVGFKRELTADKVRHLHKSHGRPETEQPRGQIAITAKDILKIPFITRQFSTVSVSDRNKKFQRLVYECVIGMFRYVYIEEIRPVTNIKKIAKSEKGVLWSVSIRKYKK
jgi:hypothetical protein